MRQLPSNLLFSQIAFFCGMEPACNTFGSTEALEIGMFTFLLSCLFMFILYLKAICLLQQNIMLNVTMLLLEFWKNGKKLWMFQRLMYRHIIKDPKKFTKNILKINQKIRIFSKSKHHHSLKISSELTSRLKLSFIIFADKDCTVNI